MRFPEALRKADEIGFPYLKGAYINIYPEYWNGESLPPVCAIGGANLALNYDRFTKRDKWGFVASSLAHQHMLPRWGLRQRLDEGPVGCSECGSWQTDIADIVVHLNDSHEWARAAIADFLDTLPVEFPEIEEAVV